MSMKGQVAVVTGAGRGIGRAISKRLAQEGAHVVLASRTAPELEETHRAIVNAGGEATMQPTDVADQAAVDALFSRVERKIGPVNLLVNNAARFNCIGPVWEVDPGDWWQDVTVNILGVFLCCRSALHYMLPRGGGRIINLIGGGTHGPFRYGSGYGTSKAAVMRFTECLAAELADTDIAVFAMGPGLVKTAMTMLQVETEAGRKYLPQIQDAFANGVDVPPERAAELTVRLASGRYDALRGRAFDVHDDMDRVAKEIDEVIEKDLRTLRMR